MKERETDREIEKASGESLAHYFKIRQHISCAPVGCHPSKSQSRAFKGMWGPPIPLGSSDEVERESLTSGPVYYPCFYLDTPN